MTTVVIYYALTALLVPVLLVVLVGLALAAVRYRQRRSRGAMAALVAFLVAAVAVTGLIALGSYESYRLENLWAFNYSVSIQGNGTSPEAVIVPIPEDWGLLAGLKLHQGSANWSLVNTAHGRGLYVRFAGSALIETYVSQFPRPNPQPNASPSMTQPSNCTIPSRNCTGYPSYWMFYSGGAGAWALVSFPYESMGGYVKQGWAKYDIIPHAVY